MVTGKSSEEPEHGKLKNPDVRQRHGKRKKGKERMREVRENKKFKIAEEKGQEKTEGGFSEISRKPVSGSLVI